MGIEAMILAATKGSSEHSARKLIAAGDKPSGILQKRTE